MTQSDKHVQSRHRPSNLPEGPPPVGGGDPQPDDEGHVEHEWLSQKQGWRLTLAALAVPVVLVLGSFVAMLWFWWTG